MELPKDMTPEQYQELFINVVIQMIVRFPDGESRIMAALTELEGKLEGRPQFQLIQGGMN